MSRLLTENLLNCGGKGTQRGRPLGPAGEMKDAMGLSTPTVLGPGNTGVCDLP